MAIGGWPLGFVRLIGAQLARMTGRLKDVARQAEEALTLLSAAGVGWAEAYAIDLVIEKLSDAGEHERCRLLASRGLLLCRAAGSLELEGRLLLQLGVAEHRLGAPQVGREHVERAVGLIARASGFDPGGDVAATASGGNRTADGDAPPPIDDAHTDGLDGTSLGFAHLTAGVLARERGDPATSASHLGAAAALLSAIPTPYGRAWVAVERCLTALAIGDLQAARSHGGLGVELAAEVGEPELLARAHEAYSEATTAAG